MGLQTPRQNPEALYGRERPPVSVGCTSATASPACGYGSNFRLRELQSAIGRIQLQRLPVARELGETSLMDLVHPTITPEQMAAYADAVRSVVLRACR